MNPRRVVVAAAAAWLVVVVVGSVLAWAVISRAGEEVSGDTTDIPSTTRSGPSDPTRSTGPTDDPSSPSSSDPTSSASTSASPGGKPVQRTWQGLGGFVVAECRGAAAGLIGAQADSGFVVEVKDRGPEHVDVEFEGQGDSQQESRVRAECVDGVPLFEVDTDTD